MEIAPTPSAPYYAVIFTSIRKPEDNGYEEMANRMVELAHEQKGFLGVESARNDIGITVSYWQSLEDIKNWKQVNEHVLAQERGRTNWYKEYKVRICLVERDYAF